jgi:triacylglycerol esterase/lipase EstA (alpha/beta hydrolase family)
MLTFISKASTLLRIVVGIQLSIALLIAYKTPWSSLSGSVNWFVFTVSAVVAFFALRFVIVALQFGISFVAGSPTPHSRRLGFFGALRTFWNEATASFSAFVWRMPFTPYVPMTQPAQPTRASRKLAVLMVHGYGCNRAMWLKFSRGLALHGYASEAINLEPPLGSIDDYPALIEIGLKALIAKTGAEQIAIVAHSMGGLAIRAFLSVSTPEQNKRIFKVITLGTPHQGTVHAALGQGKNTHQMRRKSAWRDELAARERTTDIAKLVCILTHHDNIVAPQALQTLAGAKTIELYGIGHVALAYSDEVLQLVIYELQDFHQEY